MIGKYIGEIVEISPETFITYIKDTSYMDLSRIVEFERDNVPEELLKEGQKVYVLLAEKSGTVIFGESFDLKVIEIIK